ncbi:MAG: class I SAM-dependent methyltransferase [Lachnospiraceae bacterium]|nr:class I SAM-dependent methyltransferase [Lachnospiraceae bacterium]
MNDTYTSFAAVYDSFMNDIPYKKWADFVTAKYRQSGIRSKLACDLGCGTGRLTRLLAKRGFDMIGVDVSPEMLDIAKEKDDVTSTLYLCQDMREFELFGTVGTIVSACDCVNYITDMRDLKRVFRLVNNYLEPRGLFVFDFHTEHYYRDILANNTFAANYEDASFIWENEYDKKTGKNSYFLTVYAKEGEAYRRFEELHIQRGYTLETIKKLIEDAGLEFEGAFDDYGEAPATPDSKRITVVAREKFCPGKHYE